jgi:hypothetical protein
MTVTPDTMVDLDLDLDLVLDQGQCRQDIAIIVTTTGGAEVVMRNGPSTMCLSRIVAALVA